MNEDALAAVVAAAHLLLERSRMDGAAPAVSGWIIAGRVRVADARQAQVAARARSRWAVSGRLRG